METKNGSQLLLEYRKEWHIFFTAFHDILSTLFMKTTQSVDFSGYVIFTDRQCLIIQCGSTPGGDVWSIFWNYAWASLRKNMYFLAHYTPEYKHHAEFVFMSVAGHLLSLVMVLNAIIDPKRMGSYNVTPRLEKSTKCNAPTCAPVSHHWANGSSGSQAPYALLRYL